MASSFDEPRTPCLLAGGVSDNPVSEKKAARRKLLEEVEQRRRENYLRFMQKKRQLQTESGLL